MKLDTSNVATWLVIIFAVVGGVLVILSAAVEVDAPLALTFDQYIKSMVIAIGALAVGRGINSYTKGT